MIKREVDDFWRVELEYSTELIRIYFNKIYIFFLSRTIALVPPDDTNNALAWPDCRTAPSKSGGKQLKTQTKTQFIMLSFHFSHGKPKNST